jgi:hypothetical protein
MRRRDPTCATDLPIKIRRTTMKRLMGFVCLFAAMSIGVSANSDKLAAELKELRSEKKRIAVMANELGSLARGQHITSWETHSLALQNLKEQINRSGRRLAAIQSSAGASVQVSALRDELAAVARQVNAIKQSINDNRLVTRMPSYYSDVMKLVDLAERSEKVAEKVIAAALAAPSATQTTD